MTLIQGVTHQHKTDIDIITWSYQNVHKDKSTIATLVVGWSLWTSAIIYITYLFFTNKDAQIFSGKIILLYFSIGGWIVVFSLLMWFFSLFSTETIMISDTKVIHRRSGLFSHNNFFNDDQLKGISFEKYSKSSDDLWERSPTLNFIYSGKFWIFSPEKRVVVAYWMTIKETYQLYLLLENILKDRGWDIEYRLTYQPK